MCIQTLPALVFVKGCVRISWQQQRTVAGCWQGGKKRTDLALKRLHDGAAWLGLQRPILCLHNQLLHLTLGLQPISDNVVRMTVSHTTVTVKMEVITLAFPVMTTKVMMLFVER